MGGDEEDLGAVGDERGDVAEVGAHGEVDASEAAGVPTETAGELRELRRKCREL